MCLEILIQVDKKYQLWYIPGAKAVTDPPEDLTTLIK